MRYVARFFCVMVTAMGLPYHAQAESSTPSSSRSLATAASTTTSPNTTSSTNNSSSTNNASSKSTSSKTTSNKSSSSTKISNSGISNNATSNANVAMKSTQNQAGSNSNNSLSTRSLSSNNALSNNASNTSSSISTTLANGLKVIIKEDKRAPLAMVQIWYAVGGADEPEQLSGISHVLEHMMFKGTVKVPNDELKRINARYGGSLNAFTSNNYTYYYQFYPKDYVSLALELEADRMSNLLMRQQDFATEIQVVMEERRQRTDDNPQALAFEKFRYIAYPTSRYRMPVIGHMHNLQNIQLADLQQWYKTWYAPNNATLVIVGDVNPQQTLIQVQRYFGDISRKTLPARQPVNEKPFTGHRHLDEYDNIQVPNLYMSWNVPSLVTTTQPRQIYALALFRDILDGGLSSRLKTKLVREQKILTTVSVSYDMVNRGDTLFTITAIPAANVSLQDAQNAIQGVIDELKTNPIDIQELQRVQSSTLSQLIYGQDTLRGQAQLIGSLQVNGLSPNLIEQFPKDYDSITPQEIQSTVQQYFSSENMATLYLQGLDKKPAPPSPVIPPTVEANTANPVEAAVQEEVK